MQDNVIIGVNILETLTTGMYRDAKVIFREYIQNACDQIDEAVECSLLESNEGNVEIWIKNDYVSIEDNATGIPAELFKKTLYSIGESEKIAGKSRGFRGIGHWCGFAHCETLVFTAKTEGENIESVMTCDAAKMRLMMLDHRLKKVYYTIDDVLSKTTVFTTNQTNNIGSHYFKVEMFGIKDAKRELCNEQNVKDYLSFIIPVGYATEFRFRKKIHDYAAKINQPIQEYNIRVNGGAVLKKYQPSFSTYGKGDDTITDVKFKEFNDDGGNLIAWMWFGISSFKAQIVPTNKMRGIRLRSRNIQIGNEDTLQRLFNESNGRGLYYYIGEVFAISNELLPDSQRDYFESGAARTQFEQFLYEFFNNELKSIYYAGSKVGAAYDKIEKAEQLEEEIIFTESSGKSVTEEQRNKFEEAQKKAENAKLELSKLREKNSSKLNNDNFGTVDAVVNEIIKKNEEKLANRSRRPVLQKPISTIEKSTTETNIKIIEVSKPTFANKSDEKLVPLSKIRDIIFKLADPSTAEAIIAKIEEELF